MAKFLLKRSLKRLHQHLITDLSRSTVKEHVESMRVALSKFQRSNVISGRATWTNAEANNRDLKWSCFNIRLSLYSRLRSHNKQFRCELLDDSESRPVGVFRHAAAALCIYATRIINNPNNFAAQSAAAMRLAVVLRLRVCYDMHCSKPPAPALTDATGLRTH